MEMNTCGLVIIINIFIIPAWTYIFVGGLNSLISNLHLDRFKIVPRKANYNFAFYVLINFYVAISNKAF